MKNMSLEKRILVFEKKQYLYSALGLFLLCFLSVIINNAHLNTVAHESTRFLSRMIQIGDFREVTLVLQQARLSSFTKIQYKSPQPDKSFTLPPKYDVLENSNRFWDSFNITFVTVPVQAHLNSTSSDEIIFYFNKFRLVPHAFLFWLILNIVSIPQTRYLKRKLIEQFEDDLKKEESKNKLETELSSWMNLCEEKDLVCRQIYHDLASPLGLLKVSTFKLGDQALSKPFALSLDRLMKISEDLKSQKYIWGSENPKLETLKQTLDAILQEKRLLTAHLKIQFELKAGKNSLDKIPDIPTSQFHRVLSNILNNAIDSIQNKGSIRILTRTLENKIQLFIADSGSGIPKNIAPYIFEKQQSFNKAEGSGLGLYHAKTCIEAFGGNLRLLQTKHGAGFKIELPLAR